MIAIANVDFLRQRRQPTIGWVLLMAGLAVAGAALWWQQSWAERRDAALSLVSQRILAERSRVQALKPSQPTLAQQRWSAAQQELRRPWMATLRAVEAATVNPVYLMSLSIEPATGAVRLEAEAPSFDHALAYVQVLDEGGTLLPGVLVSHEQLKGVQPTRIHFAVTTAWRNADLVERKP
jgi:hypothetical protein